MFDLAKGTMWDVEQSFYEAAFDGFLEIRFPGIHLLDGCDQGNRIHFEGDALVHTAKVFSYASAIGGLSASDRFVLLVAAAVHDICKPQTRCLRNGKVTFYGHDWRAARRCPEFAQNVSMDPGEAERLAWAVCWHMNVQRLLNFCPAKRLSFYQSPHWPVLQALQVADAQATWLNREGSECAPILQSLFAADHVQLLTAAVARETVRV